MQKKIIQIPRELSQVAAVSLIKSAQKETQEVLYVDLTDTGFPLSRDFFFVLSRRFHADEITLIVDDAAELKMAQSIGLSAELKGTFAEFEREYEQKNLLAHNMTMWQYFIYEVKRGLNYLRFLLVEKIFRKKKEKVFRYRQSSSHMFLIIAGLIVSVTLLLFIFRFAVSRTYVTIIPQITVKPISANIIYSRNGSSDSELQVAKNIITQRVVTIPVTQDMVFTLDTIDPNSTSNAQGTITLYNELTTDQSLRPQTRLVTEDGEIFRTQSWVNVPRSQTINGITEIGRIDVTVIADPNDEAGKVIGKRGNISAGTDLTIPGLKFNRDKVYAKARENFTGGQDPSIHVVTEEEVNKFKGVLHEQLMRSARDELQRKLDENKHNSGEDYALLMAEGIAFTGETMDIISGQAFGDPANEITLRGNLTVQAIVYDRKATIEYLTARFREGLLQGTDKELLINTGALRLSNVVSKTDDDTRIKATMEMTANVTYDFENTTNELTRHIKFLIAGISRDEAIKKLKDDGYVKDVSIQFSPFWVSTVSSNIDNIDFILNQEER